MDMQFIGPFLAVDFKQSYKKTAIHVTVVIFAVNIYLFICFLLDVYIFLEKTFFYSAMLAFTFICPKLITSYMIIQFCYLTMLLRQRFKILNERLDRIEDILQRTSKSNVEYLDKIKSVSKISYNPKEFLEEKVVQAIDKIRLNHYTLCDISYELNSAYSVQILFTSLQTFVTLLSCFFYCINDILFGKLESPQLIIPYTINIAVLSLWQISSIVVNASATKIEAARTGRIIHKTVPMTKDKELEAELIYFSLQLLHHNVNFTACRMFPLNEQLLLSMIGVICTYLVIVIQFEYGLIPKSKTEE